MAVKGVDMDFLNETSASAADRDVGDECDNRAGSACSGARIAYMCGGIRRPLSRRAVMRPVSLTSSLFSA